MKKFDCTVEYKLKSYTIYAKNKTEAKKKLKKRLMKKNGWQNREEGRTYIEEF